MRDIGDLRQRQALPLQAKVHMSQARIREWYDRYDGNVCISFSGGKDSTVLAHIVHDIYPDVPLIFCNTGLEYPEIQAFAKKMGAEFIRPKMSFTEVISTYGYPIISKENAEAIHYARIIRNGGGQTTERKRIELNGRRIAGAKNPSPENNGGGGTERQHTDGQTSHRFLIDVSRKNWMAKGNTYRETARRRADITATRNQFDRTGVDGNHGEDEPSPG